MMIEAAISAESDEAIAFRAWMPGEIARLETGAWLLAVIESGIALRCGD
jgi:hypothetical protein